MFRLIFKRCMHNDTLVFRRLILLAGPTHFVTSLWLCRNPKNDNVSHIHGDDQTQRGRDLLVRALLGFCQECSRGKWWQSLVIRENVVVDECLPELRPADNFLLPASTGISLVSKSLKHPALPHSQYSCIIAKDSVYTTRQYTRDV
jgi:hypothetical protein